MANDRFADALLARLVAPGCVDEGDSQAEHVLHHLDGLVLSETYDRDTAHPYPEELQASFA